MTQQHYRLLAQAIRDTAHAYKSPRAMADAAASIGAELHRDNPRFKPAVWMAACRPTWIVGTSKQAWWDRAERKLTAIITERTNDGEGRTA